MTDRVSRRTRSRLMATMPKSGTTPERKLVALLRARGVACFPQARVAVPESSRLIEVDVFVPRYRLSLFVDGCFWHGHAHALNNGAGIPAAWRRKISATMLRDRRIQKRLSRGAWKAERLWACEISRELVAEVLRRAAAGKGRK